MTITKLKTKNQLTIPSAIVRRLGLHLNELFAVEIESNFIKLTPVKIEPKYTSDELKIIDAIVEREKGKGKTFETGKDFSAYLKKLKK